MNFKNHKYQNVKTEDYSDQDQNEQQYFTDDDDHNIQQVINPVYNVNSYLDLNKNNHNNHQPAQKTHTNNKRNNSFLNIITKAIRNLIDTKNDDQTKSLLDYSNSKQIKIDEIKLNKQNNQINFKLQMPFSLFKPEQIEMFQTKKCFRKKTQTNSSESESEFNDYYESDYNKITRKKNKKRCLKSHHQSEQNLFDLNRKDFTEFSLQSLSSYHNKSNMNESNRRNINWIIFFTVISVIFNPVIGPIAFCYAIKSKLLSLNDIEKSTRFKQTAKQLVIASLLVTFMFVLVPFILFMYQNEIFRINQTLNNSTNLTTTSTTTTTTTNIFTTSSSTLFTNSTRLYESNVYLTKIFKTLIATTTTTTKTTTTTTTTTSKPIVLRSYDKLNILIDHDLFKSLKINTDLFQRLKITNQTLILN
jgi:hypothetical protein